jgi:PIN domain nuclease of toxin-antitoxin system
MYVSDTHSLIYHAQLKPARLGKKARRLFLDAEAGKTVIYVPAVVLWEVWARVKEGDFSLPMRFDHWCRGLDASPGFAVAPLGWQVIDESRRFPFNDPFDCLIAGTAAHLGMPLITKDADISESGLVETIW